MTNPRVFAAKDGSKIKLDEAVVGRLAIYRQLDLADMEAGGVLLGRHLLGCSHKVVDEVTEPMTGDRRSRYQWKRAHVRHQCHIDRSWEASGRTCTYLGEWHTHPEPVPTPSRTDLDDWRRRLRTDVFDGDTLYFVIVGTALIRVWEGHRRDLTISLLEEG